MESLVYQGVCTDYATDSKVLVWETQKHCSENLQDPQMC